MDLSLIETLRWEPGIGFVRLERHLARLARSATALGLAGAESARDALFAALPSSAATGTERAEPLAQPLRIRLELFAEGPIEVQTAAFTPLAANAAWRLKFAAIRLSSTDTLLRHKTSRRAAYAAARAEIPATEADEILLLNERGEVCEGTITSLFLNDGSGLLKTPPLSSGLLAGVLREELLETGKATEQVLRPENLAHGTILMGNSLRGLIRSTLA